MTQAPETVMSAAEIGELLRARREARGLTQAQVADMIGVHRRYIYALESGQGGLYVERVTKLLGLLGVTLRPEIDGVAPKPRARSAAQKNAAAARPAKVDDGEGSPGAESAPRGGMFSGWRRRR